MRAVISLSFLVAFAAACASDGGGSKPDATLEATLPASFAQVSNVVELSDGRVAFADTRARLFLIGDFRTGSVDTLGTRVDTVPPGAAASVYKFPGWLAHLAADTLALVDFAAIRTTLWTERGEPVAALPIVPVGGATPILAYDHGGYGYKVDYTGILGGAEPGAVINRDSLAVLRIHLTTGRVDTVAQLAGPEFGDAIFGEQRQRVAKIFSPNDIFGVLPDGRVWIARGRENRVDWRRNDGVWVHGQPREYTPVPVTDEDRQRVIARVREEGRGRGLPKNLRLVWPFADHKPPFEAGMASPSGEVWLQRPRASGETQYVYDVVGPDGVWQRAVTFPPDITLAGFGKNGTIYGVVKEGEQRRIGKLAVKD